MYYSKLKETIREAFYTQERFALAVGEDGTYVSRVINGLREISDERKKKWADALGKTVEELFPADKK